jgi:hypothetical protein
MFMLLSKLANVQMRLRATNMAVIATWPSEGTPTAPLMECFLIFLQNI